MADATDYEIFRARRAAATKMLQQQTGLDDAIIEKLVRVFYGEVMQDALLAPIFAAKITDWEPHLQQMMRFWSSVALASGAYEGQPMPKHVTLPIEAKHFERWLEIFERTARDVCPAAGAERVIDGARKIAANLLDGVTRFRAARLNQERTSAAPAFAN